MDKNSSQTISNNLVESPDKKPENHSEEQLDKSYDRDIKSTALPHYLGLILLIVTTILWGSTFTITNQVTQHIPPIFYMTFRYLIGFLVYIPFFCHFRKINREFWKITLTASFLLWASFTLQTIGIQLTTATKSAFITGLNVIMIPIFAAVIYKRRVRGIIWVSTVLALIGVSIMSFSGFDSIELGDVLVFICDIFYALYILYLERKLPFVGIISFSAFQLAFLSLFSFISSLIFEVSVNSFVSTFRIFLQTPFYWYILYMGVIATSFATIIQMKGQRAVTATQAAIIYALEPIFGALFAAILGNEDITWQIIVGGGLIMTGIFLSISKKKKYNFDTERKKSCKK
ncbi:MAG: hypothetical protein DRO88_00150 [Promethearchaeia archaeon]|nr:MAG: hypothetical protein DRO88_00150 [Candidatus Lokiarchaeia archaeon]